MAAPLDNKNHDFVRYIDVQSQMWKWYNTTIWHFIIISHNLLSHSRHSTLDAMLHRVLSFTSILYSIFPYIFPYLTFLPCPLLLPHFALSSPFTQNLWRFPGIAVSWISCILAVKFDLTSQEHDNNFNDTHVKLLAKFDGRKLW